MKITIQDLQQLQEKDKCTPVLRGCTNEQCYCTGACKQVIGYWQNGVYTPLPKSNGIDKLETQYTYNRERFNDIANGRD